MSEEENIPEDSLKEQPPDSNKEFAYENIPENQITVELQPTIPLSEIKDMEVHHHTHPGHHNKKWTDYFWEFLMLFLAVFCGFLAEYQLEHSLEKQRAKDFAVSLHRDLSSDTTVFNSSIDRLNLCIKKIDTLIKILTKSEEAKKKNSSIYNLSVYAFITPISTPTESTLQQLLNSGSLRYLKNDLLVDSIKIYSNSLQIFKNFSASTTSFTTEFRKNQLEIVEINPLIEFLDSNRLMSNNLGKNITDTSFFGNRELLTTEPLRLKKYANWCALKKYYLTNSVVMYKRLHVDAHAVLGLLKKEYHLQ